MAEHPVNKEGLNAVDIFVRGQMLKHPSIFPRRIDVLGHFWAVLGNGYGGGVPTSDYARDLWEGEVLTINMDDLDPDKAFEHTPELREIVVDDEWLEKNEQERKDREARLLMINQLCQRQVELGCQTGKTAEGSELGPYDLRGAYYSLAGGNGILDYRASNWTTLGRVHGTNRPSAVWLESAVELVEACIRGFTYCNRTDYLEDGFNYEDQGEILEEARRYANLLREGRISEIVFAPPIPHKYRKDGEKLFNPPAPKKPRVSRAKKVKA